MGGPCSGARVDRGRAVAQPFSWVIAGLDPAIHEASQRVMSVYRSRHFGLAESTHNNFQARDEFDVVFTLDRSSRLIELLEGDEHFKYLELGEDFYQARPVLMDSADEFVRHVNVERAAWLFC